jgi:hypothetical protein
MASDIQGGIAVAIPLADVDITSPVSGAPRSAVSWAAILAGAFVAAAVSLLLLILGSGFGLGMAPWARTGAAVATFSVVAGIWLIVTQWIAALLGGYITGRLRTRWTGTHTHEVFFRDTAHGFLTWSVSTVLVVVLAAGGASLLAGAAHHEGEGADAGRTAEGRGGEGYTIDRLFRAAKPDDSPSAAAARVEAGRIFPRVVAQPPQAPADDRLYLGDLVAQHTGLTRPDAQTRVDALVDNARADAAKARKAGAATAIFTALSMLIGAFIASVAAALGGRLRDEHV